MGPPINNSSPNSRRFTYTQTIPTSLAFQFLEPLFSNDLVLCLASVTQSHDHVHKDPIMTNNYNPSMSSFSFISLPDQHIPFLLTPSGTQTPSILRPQIRPPIHWSYLTYSPSSTDTPSFLLTQLIPWQIIIINPFLCIPSSPLPLSHIITLVLAKPH